MTPVSLLIPWRTDNGVRARHWEWARPRWSAPGIEVCIGTDDGEPFSVARAVNDAARHATHDVFAVMGADMFPAPGIMLAAAEQRPWCMPYVDTVYMSEQSTEAVMADGNTLPAVGTSAGCCFGVVVVPRWMWEDVGGMDERFAGWGPEDQALVAALTVLHGKPACLPWIAYHLWHPPASNERTNDALFDSEYRDADRNTMRRTVERAKASRCA